ncbi:MAG: hypothetical protein GY797_40100 [Deltaproteobacteria bacterium]|nr:hypothetical protein [Deltaproteobacteria bacterium]
MTEKENEISGFYDDDGTKIDPNLIEKPSLCTTCKKDDEEKEEMICTMNRIDQQGECEFVCEAHISKFHIDSDVNEEETNNDDVIKF